MEFLSNCFTYAELIGTEAIFCLDFSSNAEVLRISQVRKQDKYSELLLVATDLKTFLKTQVSLKERAWKNGTDKYRHSSLLPAQYLEIDSYKNIVS